MTKKLKKLMYAGLALAAIAPALGAVSTNNTHIGITAQAKSHSYEAKPHSHWKSFLKRARVGHRGKRPSAKEVLYQMHLGRKPKRRTKRAKRGFKREAVARRIYKTFRKHYHLSRTHAAGLTAVAGKASQFKNTAHQVGGGSGFGLFQINSKKGLRRWSHKHHMNYKTCRAQSEYYYNKFVKHSGYLKTHGSAAHEGREAEIKVQRSAMPLTNIVARYATKIYKAFK